MTLTFHPTPTISPEAARNAALDLRVIRNLMDDLGRVPANTRDVLQATPAVLSVLTRVRDWSAQAVAELEGA